MTSDTTLRREARRLRSAGLSYEDVAVMCSVDGWWFTSTWAFVACNPHKSLDQVMAWSGKHDPELQQRQVVMRNGKLSLWREDT